MRKSIERFPNHATDLCPRLILGLWHPKFIKPSMEILPELKKAHIGNSPSVATKYFWDSCDGFSMKFSCLVSGEGVEFRRRCKAEGKALLVWTVNQRSEMIEAAKWGVDAILTDKTQLYLQLRQQMKGMLLSSYLALVSPIWPWSCVWSQMTGPLSVQKPRHCSLTLQYITLLSHLGSPRLGHLIIL